MKKLTILITCASILALAATAAAPVWKVSHAGSHLYIGGTMHLLAKEDYPLPPAFEQAYCDSQVLCFEVDLTALSSVEFMQKLMAQSMYTGDDEITKHLKAETVEKLKSHLQTQNLTLEPFKKMKPGFLSIMLVNVEMQRLGMTESGVDQFYNDKAIKDKKRLAALETPEEQLEFISKMGAGIEDDVILHSIEELGELASLMDQTKATWRVGNLKELEKAALDPWRPDFPELYKELVVDRNNNWLPQIKKMLQSPENEFVLVGALHLAGEQGVLEQLRKAGYTVKQLD